MVVKRLLVELPAIGMLTILLGGCRREPLVFAVEPQIEILSISPKTVPEFGELRITLRYKDGDGDLGGQPDGRANLFLIDLRDSALFPEGYDGLLRYNMPRFLEGPPQSIQGTIEITLPGIARLNPNSPQEAVAFEVYILDRAGHESNRARTDTVYIVP